MRSDVLFYRYRGLYFGCLQLLRNCMLVEINDKIYEALVFNNNISNNELLVV